MPVGELLTSAAAAPACNGVLQGVKPNAVNSVPAAFMFGFVEELERLLKYSLHPELRIAPCRICVTRKCRIPLFSWLMAEMALGTCKTPLAGCIRITSGDGPHRRSCSVLADKTSW